MNTRIPTSAAVAGVLASAAFVLPAFAQDIPDISSVIPGVPNIPTVPRGIVPRLPILPNGIPQGGQTSQDGSQVPGRFVPRARIEAYQNQQQVDQSDDSATNDGEWTDGATGATVPVRRPVPIRVGADGVQVGAMRVSADGVQDDEMEVGPNGVRVPGMQVTPDGVKMRGMEVGPNGVRVGGMRVSSTSVEVRGMRVGQDGVVMPGAPALGGLFRVGTSTNGVGLNFASFGRASELVSGFTKQAQGGIDAVKQRADDEIAKRIEALTALQQRVGQMTQLSEEDKANLSQELATQIASLSSLRDSISSTVATSTLKTDVQSITKSFRTFALTVPKGAITAAAGRIDSLVGDMQTIGAKLKTLVDNAAASGADVSSAQSAYDDFVAKLADAQSQADAARAEIADLQADNGDEDVYKSNVAALKDAQSKIQAANTTLKDARTDITSIRKTLAGVQASASQESTDTSGNASE